SIVFYSAEKLETELVLLRFECEGIIAECGRRVHEKPWTEHVVPARRNSGVTPGNGEGRIAAFTPGESEHVPTEISTEKNAVLFTQPVIRLGIQIIEIVAAAADLR